MMELTEAMLVAGLKETEPLGELINWQEGFGREEMAKAFAAMMAQAAPDFDAEAVAWAYGKCVALGLENGSMESAMMMDRLKLMLS